MGEKLYSSYFESLQNKAYKIDNGIDRLSEIWKTPHLLIGGYGERPVEMDTYLEELWKSIRDTNDAIEKSRKKLELSLEKTDQFLSEAQASFEDLKTKSDNIDIVLAEYGYNYEEYKDMSESDHRNFNKNCTDEDILYTKEVEVEFTPNLTWKCKAKVKESDISISNQEKPTVKCIATPVIKSLASVFHSENHKAKD
ncbi:hypothetical protein EAI_17412 [Harpegnathos saltator]|uniref:Uncharacterized protein n=2 Tax=Harpegnathos saltator TaxID=610380 RepID=E2BG90_HARSA|nr:hypothetical protein EAI_17412 [Harpegnathos saltator]